MEKYIKDKQLKKFEFFILRLLSIISIPVFGLIPVETKIVIYDLFPNEFCRIITLIFIIVLMFAWFIYISNIILKIKQK